MLNIFSTLTNDPSNIFRRAREPVGQHMRTLEYGQLRAIARYFTHVRWTVKYYKSTTSSYSTCMHVIAYIHASIQFMSDWLFERKPLSMTKDFTTDLLVSGPTVDIQPEQQGHSNFHHILHPKFGSHKPRPFRLGHWDHQQF